MNNINLLMVCRIFVKFCMFSNFLSLLDIDFKLVGSYEIVVYILWLYFLEKILMCVLFILLC